MTEGVSPALCISACVSLTVAMLKPDVRQEGTVVKQVVEIPVITYEACSML